MLFEQRILIKILLCLMLFSMASCGALNNGFFSDPLAGKPDAPLDPTIQTWLKPGEQTRVTPEIATVADRLTTGSRRARLVEAMRYIWHHYPYVEELNGTQFSLTAGQIFKRRQLGGCSDFALIYLPLLREMGIPSRLILTANTGWISEAKRQLMGIPTGHSFIEVYLEDRWHLFDPTYRWLYSGYDPESKFLPRGEWFLARGVDFWDLGIHSVQTANEKMIQLAEAYNDDYHTPDYRVIKFMDSEFELRPFVPIPAP